MRFRQTRQASVVFGVRQNPVLRLCSHLPKQLIKRHTLANPAPPQPKRLADAELNANSTLRRNGVELFEAHKLLVGSSPVENHTIVMASRVFGRLDRLVLSQNELLTERFVDSLATFGRIAPTQRSQSTAADNECSVLPSQTLLPYR